MPAVFADAMKWRSFSTVSVRRRASIASSPGNTDGNRVVVFGFYSGKGRSTQKPFATKWTMVFTIQGGKVSGFHEYFDTHNLGSAFI